MATSLYDLSVPTFLQTFGKAETALMAFTPEEVNSWAGKDLDLQIGPRRLAFTPETLYRRGSRARHYRHPHDEEQNYLFGHTRNQGR